MPTRLITTPVSRQSPRRCGGSFWPLELASLLCSPIYQGAGVAHGHGEPVLVIPGFLANDLMMIPLRRWLKRIGYRPYLSDIAWNTDCPNKTALRLVQKIKVIHRKTGRRVILIGHSLGGMLAKSILQHVPELIDRVITLGSPFRDHVRAHPAVTGVWEYLLSGQGKLIGRNLHASCGTGFCMCDFVRHMLQPEARPVPQFAIYSRNDGVVDWISCAEEDAMANTEINEATHIGLIFHPAHWRRLPSGSPSASKPPIPAVDVGGAAGRPEGSPGDDWQFDAGRAGGRMENALQCRLRGGCRTGALSGVGIAVVARKVARSDHHPQPVSRRDYRRGRP